MTRDGLSAAIDLPEHVTVAQLMQVLSTLPGDMLVTYDVDSGYDAFEPTVLAVDRASNRVVLG